MKKIAIIDDDKDILASLELTLKEIDSRFEVDSYLHFEQLLDAVKEIKTYDVYIVDVFLDQNPSGINYVNKLYDLQPGAFVIFISGKPKGTFDVYDANHIYFLEKPILKAGLNKALTRVFDLQKKNVLKIEFMNNTNYISFLDIIYIESSGRKVIINTLHDAYQTYAKLDEISSMLPSYFKRIHKSYIINKKFVKVENRDSITLINGQNFNISRTYIQKES